MIVYWSKLNKDLLMATRPRTLKIPRGLLTLPGYTTCGGLPKALSNHIACVGASLLGALGLPTMLLKYSNTLIVGSCKLSLPSFCLLLQVVVRQPLLIDCVCVPFVAFLLTCCYLDSASLWPTRRVSFDVRVYINASSCLVIVCPVVVVSSS
jgi:hypothetical protein